MSFWLSFLGAGKSRSNQSRIVSIDSVLPSRSTSLTGNSAEQLLPETDEPSGAPRVTLSNSSPQLSSSSWNLLLFRPPPISSSLVARQSQVTQQQQQQQRLTREATKITLNPVAGSNKPEPISNLSSHPSPNVYRTATLSGAPISSSAALTQVMAVASAGLSAGGNHHSLPPGPTTRAKLDLLYRYQKRLLFSGILAYIGYYLLRTDLIVSLNTILKSLPGVDKAEFGTILSFGYVCYAGGKVFSGILIDRYGGAPIFKMGIVASLFASLLFTMIHVEYDEEQRVVDPNHVLALYGVVWSINRAAQSAGWGALLKTFYNWFPQSMHGRVLGIASLSYGLGDVGIRIFLGGILASISEETGVTDPVTGKSDPLKAQLAWTHIFHISILTTCVLIVPCFYMFYSYPAHVPELVSLTEDELQFGEQMLTDDPTSKDKAFRETRTNTASSVHDVVRFLVRSPKFWTLVVMSPCLTLIRESFISWTAVFLSDVLKLKDGDAAMMSMLVPLFGTFSTLIGGWVIDRVRPQRRGLVFSGCLFLLTVILVRATLYIPEGPGAVVESKFAIFAMLSLIAVTLMAPFSFVDGLFVLALAGNRGPGLAVGIVNGVGYMGAILAGHEVGLMAELYGWHYVFAVLTSISGVTFVTSLAYWWLDLRDLRRRGSFSRPITR